MPFSATLKSPSSIRELSSMGIMIGYMYCSLDEQFLLHLIPNANSSSALGFSCRLPPWVDQPSKNPWVLKHFCSL